MLNQASEFLTQQLTPVADWFGSFGIPASITHWGHPAMMAIVVLVMGSAVGLAGWRGRLLPAGEAATISLSNHGLWAKLMYLFIALGYTGGLLSLIMQHHSPLQSPHFWTGSAVLLLLSTNAVLSATGFGGNKQALRSAHAYLGSATLFLMFGHALLGLKLGLSLS